MQWHDPEPYDDALERIRVVIFWLMIAVGVGYGLSLLALIL